MTKAEIAKRLKAMGIKATKEEDARKELLAILKKEGIEGMEEEETDVLLEMAESFKDDDAAPEQEEEEVNDEDDGSETEEEEESEGDENPDEQEAEEGLANEAEADEKEAEETEEEEEEEEPDGDEYDAMDRKALKACLKDNDIKFKVLKSTTDEEIRNAIRTALKAREESGHTKSKKSAKKAPAKPKATKSIKLNPKTNDEDKEVFYKALGKLFPKDKYNYAWVSSSGVTIKAIGKNFNRGLVLIENASRHGDDITCNVYFLTMGKKTEVLEQHDIEYGMSWNMLPYIKRISLSEAVDIIGQLFDSITEGIDKLDKKLGDSRKKMEETLKKSQKKTAKKAAPKPKTEPDEEEEEPEDDVEQEAPAKKTAAKKTAVKKAVKKTAKK